MARSASDLAPSMHISAWAGQDPTSTHAALYAFAQARCKRVPGKETIRLSDYLRAWLVDARVTVDASGLATARERLPPPRGPS